MPKTGRLYTHNGITHTVKEWAKITGIPYYTLNHRVKTGVSDDIIFDKKIKKNYPESLEIKRVPKQNVVWTDSAKRCYDIGCRCSKCRIVPEFFKEQCRMKYTVRELVRLYGKPERGKNEKSKRI